MRSALSTDSVWGKDGSQVWWRKERGEDSVRGALVSLATEVTHQGKN